MGKCTGSKSGKEYIKAVYCHLAYLTYMQSTSCEMPGWMKLKLESRLPGDFSNLRNADDTTIMAESKEELKSLLMKVKEESENVGLKLNIQKMKTIASGPITSWQIDGETAIFLSSKITADGDCSQKLKGICSLEESYDQPEQHIKSRDITLPTKVHLVKAMFFPVVMYGYKSWTIKKAECHRIDAFELWCWKRLLSVPWAARRSNQLIRKEIILNTHWKDWC